MHYKAPDNTVHFLDSVEYEHLLPAGSVQITDAEAEAMRPKPLAPDYSAMRKAAYVAESDPIFFLSQRGEATQQEWLDKVAEIKSRWP
jgi:hypothetical protein